MTAIKREERIGGQRLILGDCLEVMPELGPVDAVVTDPPYGNNNHDGDFNAALNAFRGLESRPIANDGLEEMRRVVDAMLLSAVRLMPKKASACCCFCGGGGGAVASLRLAGGSHGSGRADLFPFGHLGQAKSGARPKIPEAT
jgi:hypothetical protein